MDFNEAKKLLIQGKKIRPIIWRKEFYIKYDNYLLGCYGEKGEIINLKALSQEEFEEVKTKSKKECRR